MALGVRLTTPDVCRVGRSTGSPHPSFVGDTDTAIVTSVGAQAVASPLVLPLLSYGAVPQIRLQG